MATYLKDLIELPEQVRQGDFVLRLTEGVLKPKETLDNYVVTEQLAKCFDQALGLIQAAVETRSSKGAYLHGSFGSGKSHFMAVLTLLLEGNPQARSIPELAPTIAKHNGWTGGKRFLLVPYHMIGARDMASAILGGYADFVTKYHPHTPYPGVYRSEQILENAQDLRERMGDTAFFAALNGTGGSNPVGDQGWGELGIAWDAPTFEKALEASPRDESRVRLVGDLVSTLLTAAKGSSEFVDLDAGLSIVSRHAKALGYDALILFLDELILWLASHAADVNFIAQEGQKLAKLVEAQNPDRPAPIVSFIARQRDLRELVGDNMIGVERVSFSDSLRHWDQRFAVIRLDDRNLPTIAEKRVLRPKNEAARQEIDQAFRETARIRDEVMNILLTSQGDRNLFRKIYPFSPALMETLVALSSLLQRERTALKIMLQLLVEQKQTLKLGEIVPVGDLFDVVMRGEEPFSEVMKAHFENARKLYQQKLLPLIEGEHALRKEDVEKMEADNPRANSFRRDDRLAKTLLLCALAPEVESFKGMTVNKLAALNHGTIKSPIAGKEGSIVYEKIRKWGAELGQIRVGDEPVNQTVSVQLASVETEAILAQAATEDNQGNRVRKIKELVCEMMGVTLEDELWLQHVFSWRGTKRACEILFANVRELNDETLRAKGDTWKVIVDYPFDPEPTHGPKDDLARVEAYRNDHPEPTLTLLWLPSFLGRQAQKELGLLVILDYVLKGDRLNNYAAALSQTDRAQARIMLENQQSSLRLKLRGYLEECYGIRLGGASTLDTAHELDPQEHFQSLDSRFELRSPIGANLNQALQQLLDTALAHQLPAHPKFESDAKLGGVTLKRVWNELEKGLQATDGRSFVEPALRRETKAIAEPLRLVEMGETHLVIDHHWKDHFLRKEAEHGGVVTVGRLRAWMDEPQSMGLPRELQNLVILFFAAHTNRSFFIHGGPDQPTLDSCEDELELREQPLPSEADWKIALNRASGIFGIQGSALCNASNVAKFGNDLKVEAAKFVEAGRSLVMELRGKLATTGTSPQESNRYKTAECAQAILENVRSATERNIIEVFAHTPLNTPEVAVGTSIKQAESVVRALRDAQWVLLESVAKLSDQRNAAGQRIRQRVKELLEGDEFAIQLVPVLRQAQDDAARLLADVPKPPPSVTIEIPPDAGRHPGKDSGTDDSVNSPVAGKSRACVWAGSDESEVAAIYANDSKKLERNRELVKALKKLYGASQVTMDKLPAGIPKEQLVEVLEVHLIQSLADQGMDERGNMLVVSPTLHALIHADPSCRIMLRERKLVLFGNELTLQVRSDHNGD